MAPRKGNVEARFSIEEKVLKRYKSYCMNEGFVMSKRVEQFMRKELGKRKSTKALPKSR